MVEPGRVVDEHLAPLLLGHTVKAARDRPAAFRPGGRGLREVRAPQQVVEADVMPGLEPRRVEPSDDMTLPLEEHGRQQVVALRLQALALELVVGELQLVGAPRKRGLGKYYFQLRKALQDPCEQEVRHYQHR